MTSHSVAFSSRLHITKDSPHFPRSQEGLLPGFPVYSRLASSQPSAAGAVYSRGNCHVTPQHMGFPFSFAACHPTRFTLVFPVYLELEDCETQREICEADQKEDFHFPDNKKVPTLPHLSCFDAENGDSVWNSRNHLDQINQGRRRNLEAGTEQTPWGNIVYQLGSFGLLICLPSDGTFYSGWTTSHEEGLLSPTAWP